MNGAVLDRKEARFTQIAFLLGSGPPIERWGNWQNFSYQGWCLCHITHIKYTVRYIFQKYFLRQMIFKMFPNRIFSAHTGKKNLLAKVTFTYRSGINGNNWRVFAGPGLISGAFVSWRVRWDKVSFFILWGQNTDALKSCFGAELNQRWTWTVKDPSRSLYIWLAVFSMYNQLNLFESPGCCKNTQWTFQSSYMSIWTVQFQIQKIYNIFYL